MNIGSTQSHGVSKTAVSMNDRQARGTAIADNIKQSTTQGQATDLLRGMRDTMQTRINNGTTNRNTLVRLAHTTKTRGDNMVFQTLDKKLGNSTRTLETKAALIAEFEAAGWDTTELHEYLDTITTRQDRILESRIFTILDNASKKADAEGPNIPIDPAQTTTPWSTDAIDHAPALGAGGQATAYKIKINNEPMVVKMYDSLKLPPPVQLDPQLTTPHIKRDTEVTAAFIIKDTRSVVSPSWFIARVTESNGEEKEILVKGGKDFKEWSKDQLWDKENNRAYQKPPKIQLIGLIMPNAGGKTLDETIIEKNVSFSQTAQSAFNALGQMASHGFVHGDIKPSNLIVKDTGDLALIDTGSMAKTTKHAKDRPFSDSISFDKKSRPTTPDHAHPGHSPDFKKVGMEQDLFSMGVTLLETKLGMIATQLDPDDAEEFIGAAQAIRDIIAEANTDPDEDSAMTIRDEIETQLKELENNYPQAFRDGEIRWAQSAINTALAQTEPITNRETWNNTLTGIRDSIPADLAHRQEILERFQKLGCSTSDQAKLKFEAFRATAESISKNETDQINQKFLGGGNSVFQVIFENPQLLDPNFSTESRQNAFFEAFDPLQSKSREENLESIELQVAPLIAEGNLVGAESLRAVLIEGANQSEQANKRDILNSLNDPELMAIFQKFQTAAHQNNLTNQDAMATIRSRENILHLNPQNVEHQLKDLYANIPISTKALSGLEILFPAAST